MQPRPLDRIFTALADPSRRGMLERLSHGPQTVKELAAPVGMRLPSAVKHLKVLEEVGMVGSHKAGRTRTYVMRPAAFSAVSAWLGAREAAMNAAFDRLASAMATVPEKE